jgi:hypothetical protein
MPNIMEKPIMRFRKCVTLLTVMLAPLLTSLAQPSKPAAASSAGISFDLSAGATQVAELVQPGVDESTLRAFIVQAWTDDLLAADAARATTERGDSSLATPASPGGCSARSTSIQLAMDTNSLARDPESAQEHSRLANPERLALQKLDHPAGAAVNLGLAQPPDSKAGTKENGSEPPETELGHTSVTEFLTQATKHSRLYLLLGENNSGNVGEFSWDKTMVHQKGLRLFGIHF